jgi:hypothetical protein
MKLHIGVLISGLVVGSLAGCKGSESTKGAETVAPATAPEQPAEPADLSAPTAVEPEPAAKPVETAPGDEPTEAKWAQPADLAAFRKQFDPLIQGEPGDERGKLTCKGYKALVAASEAIDRETAPAGVDADVWAQRIENLQVDITEMSMPCQEKDYGSVDELLTSAGGHLQKVLAL